jgi:hypothetical protein
VGRVDRRICRRTRRLHGVTRREVIDVSGPSTASVPSPPLAPFSMRLPPELIERLRVAAPQLRLRQGEIAALAIERFLRERGH